MDKKLGTKGKILLCLIRCREEGGKGLRKKNDVGEREIFIYFLSQTVLPPFHFRLCFEKKNITDFHLCFEKKNITVQKKKGVCTFVPPKNTKANNYNCMDYRSEQTSLNDPKHGCLMNIFVHFIPAFIAICSFQ